MLTHFRYYSPQEDEQEQQADQEQQDGEQQDGEQQDEAEQQQDGEQQDGEQQDEAEQQQDGEQQDGEQEGGERRLDEVVYYDNAPYIVVDCNTCEAKGCFDEEQEMYDENNANYQITDEVIEEWIQGMMECVDTEVVGPTGEDNLYAGFICNADGTGVEPAVFLDDNCAVYTSLYSYGNLVSGTNNYDIMYKATDSVTAPFLDTLSCENIQYLTIEGAENMAYEAAQQAYQQAQDGNNNQQEEQEAPEAAEVCRNLMQDAIDLKTCDGYEEEYQEEDEEEDVYNEEDEDYSWYTYLVAEDAANDAQGTCVVVATLEGEYSSAHTYTEKDKEGGGSGHVYDYKTSGAFGGDMNAGKIFGIIIAVIVVIVAAVLVIQSVGGKKDSKKVPLVSNKGGAMA